MDAVALRSEHTTAAIDVARRNGWIRIGGRDAAIRAYHVGIKLPFHGRIDLLVRH